MDDLENDKEWLNKIRNDLGHSKYESNANTDHLSMTQLLQDYENEYEFNQALRSASHLQILREKRNPVWIELYDDDEYEKKIIEKDIKNIVPAIREQKKIKKSSPKKRTTYQEDKIRIMGILDLD